MSIELTINSHRGRRTEQAAPMLAALAPEEVAPAEAFHRSMPGYAPTPLVPLPGLAARLGVASVLVKDESHRFELNAFKVLGGSYAIARHLAERLGVDIADLTYDALVSPQTREALGPVTFVTATDGNHGRGVAWTAAQLGQRCVVHMPAGSATERLENIRALGAEADVTDLNYDDAVRLAAREAEENGWVLIQDTSWDGYEDIPRAIIQGYTTMLAETVEQAAALPGAPTPTHVIVQAGVGALATATVGAIVHAYGTTAEGGPRIIVVEPERAACLFETLRAKDGQIHAVTGDLDTIMAGLACGEPVTVGMDLLADAVFAAVSIPDSVAAEGMRVLAAEGIVSGESGAAGVGLAHALLSDPDRADQARALGLDADSVLLFLSTEGATDLAGYEAIVHGEVIARA